jgi:hypothetical protein
MREKKGNAPSSAFIRGNLFERKFRDVPLAEGIVSITSQMFWKKNEGATVPDSLSNKPITCPKNH